MLASGICVVMKLLFVCAALKSTCEVNITNDQQSFALLTCHFSEPVKEFVLELKHSADGKKGEYLVCEPHRCTRFMNVETFLTWILAPNIHNSHSKTIEFPIKPKLFL